MHVAIAEPIGDAVLTPGLCFVGLKLNIALFLKITYIQADVKSKIWQEASSINNKQTVHVQINVKASPQSKYLH